MAIDIFVCGDIVNTRGKKMIDSRLEEIISNADFSICNYEAPIIDSKSRAISKAGPHLSQSMEGLKILKENGFQLLSIANNHIYDYGDNGLRNTIESIKALEMCFVGAGNSFKEAYEYRIEEIKGVKVGFISACEAEFGCLIEDENRGGYAWINHYLIEDKIRELKNQTDIIIFIAHAGVENINIPIKEWRDRYKRLCDVGVNVVVGHHPHVPQGYEHHQNSLIFYSLGNFFFDCAGHEKNSNDSYSVLLKISKYGDLDFDLIYHKSIDGIVTKQSAAEVNFSLTSLNNKLIKEIYPDLLDLTVVSLFEERYKPLYLNALSSFPIKGKIKEKIKFFIRNIFFRKRYFHKKHLLLLHNIRIDSHRYVVQRALSKLFERLNNK